MKIMIDLETMGVSPTAPIVEIGICSFDKEIKWQFNLDLVDVMMATGFIPEQGTVDWWRSQGGYKKMAASGDLRSVLETVSTLEPTELWANSPAFDLVILRSHFTAVGLKWPWSHTIERDFRTWRKIFNRSVRPPTHSALMDAEDQVDVMLAVWLELGTSA